MATEKHLHDANAASPDRSERRGSLVVDPTLASEEDAAVLTKMGSVLLDVTMCRTDTNSMFSATNRSFGATSP